MMLLPLSKYTLRNTLLACLVAFGLTACGGEDKGASANQKSDAANTSATIQDNKTTAGPNPASGEVIRVVTTGKEPPFSVEDEKGNLMGIDIDVMNAIAQSQGFQVEFTSLPWQDVLPSLNKGDYQIAINAIKYSDERAGLYGLSEPYFYDPSAFAYKKDSGITAKSLAELSGLKVGVMSQSKQEADLQNTQATVIPHKNLFSAYRDMVQGKIDVVAYDLPILQMTAKQQADQLIFVPYESKNDKGANTVIAVNKNNKALLEKLNQGIETLKASGKLDEIGKKYTE